MNTTRVANLLFGPTVFARAGTYVRSMNPFLGGSASLLSASRTGPVPYLCRLQAHPGFDPFKHFRSLLDTNKHEHTAYGANLLPPRTTTAMAHLGRLDGPDWGSLSGRTTEDCRAERARPASCFSRSSPAASPAAPCGGGSSDSFPCSKDCAAGR